ncbi:MAG TPA: response regulator, partial [Polyangiaceae bacterium]|nr:response regulator [Polyangiaceae bacterium]
MRKPRAIEGAVPEGAPLSRDGQEGLAGGKPHPGRHDSPCRDPALLGHDLRNPLAIVIANLQLLADLVAGVQAQAAVAGSLPPAAGAWLTTRMEDADSCLCDARAAAERIRDAIAPRKPLRQSASDRVPPIKEVLRPARILIVDDEESLARAMQRVFRDYDTVVHTSAQHALDRIVIGERFDVILCDVEMPGMSGCDLHEEIRSVVPEQGDRMVFVTGGPGHERTK